MAARTPRDHDLHGARLRSVGLPALADSEQVLGLEVDNRRLEIAYYRQGVLIGALTAGRTGRLARYRDRLQRAVNDAGQVCCSGTPVTQPVGRVGRGPYKALAHAALKCFRPPRHMFVGAGSW
jgi:hypothetical protein